MLGFFYPGTQKLTGLLNCELMPLLIFFLNGIRLKIRARIVWVDISQKKKVRWSRRSIQKACRGCDTNLSHAVFPCRCSDSGSSLTRCGLKFIYVHVLWKTEKSIAQLLTYWDMKLKKLWKESITQTSSQEVNFEIHSSESVNTMNTSNAFH